MLPVVTGTNIVRGNHGQRRWMRCISGTYGQNGGDRFIALADYQQSAKTALEKCRICSLIWKYTNTGKICYKKTMPIDLILTYMCWSHFLVYHTLLKYHVDITTCIILILRCFSEPSLCNCNKFKKSPYSVQVAETIFANFQSENTAMADPLTLMTLTALLWMHHVGFGKKFFTTANSGSKMCVLRLSRSAVMLCLGEQRGITRHSAMADGFFWTVDEESVPRRRFPVVGTARCLPGQAGDNFSILALSSCIYKSGLFDLPLSMISCTLCGTLVSSRALL